MFDIFCLTNGRSTYEKCLESLQINKVNFISIKNKSYVTALQFCIDSCKTDYFCKIDDDFFLHPQAICYMKEVIKNESCKKVGMFYWNLWEDYSKLIVHAIKIYRLDAIRSIGGFHFNKAGKVDKLTNEILVNKGWALKEDKSIIAIHACGNNKEQLYYNELWKQQAINPSAYKKARLEQALLYNKTIDYQFSLRTGFLERLNRKHKTPFDSWLLRQDIMM